MRWGTGGYRASTERQRVGAALVRLPAFVALICVMLAAWAFSAPALAQEPAAEQPAATAEQIDELVQTLEDPAARETLIQQLRTLQAAQTQAETAQPPADSLGAGLLADLSAEVDTIGTALGRMVERAPDLPRLVQEAVRQAGDPAARGRWIDVLIKLAIVLVAGAVAQWLVSRLLARPRRALENHGGGGFWLRIPLIIGRAVLDLVPIAAFAAAAYVVLPLTEPRQTTRLVALAFVNAHIVVRIVMVVARFFLAPETRPLRIVPLSDENATNLFVWVHRLAVVGVYGYFLIEAALLLGLARGAYMLLLRLLGLVVTAMLVVVILQNRASVAAWLRSGGATGRFGQVRQRFADIWHVLAILYIAAIFAVWALGIPGGFTFLVRATLLTALVLLILRLVIGGLRRAIARGFRPSPEFRVRHPNLDAQANRYLPLLQRVLEIAVSVVAALVLLEIWGLDVFEWLKTGLGERIAGSALAILLIIGVAVLLSELVGLLIARYLERTDREGVPVARSARIRTLLPLLRNAFRIALAVVVGMVILAELGVNIGPLLAAAGVVGLAVGFGAQTLVQDIITGAFILAEDSISIGDVVDIGGHSGSVEAMTIRTLRLRDGAGTVHTIPFSSVTTIKNLTKDFSFAMFTVGIAYREDVDSVIETLKEIGADLQADEQFAPDILEPIQVFGLDSFGDSAVNITARIKTRPLMQWTISREFNRRMKRVFDEKGIEIPFPTRTLYFGEDRQGMAPPARIRVESAEPESPA